MESNRHFLSVGNISYLFPTEKLKITCTECYKINKSRHRHRLVARIMKDFFYLILRDIIHNNVMVILPELGKNKAYIYMRAVRGDEFSLCRKKHRFKDIDFLKSFFTGYIMTLRFYKEVKWFNLEIILDKKLLKDIADYVNSGKVYTELNEKTYIDYMDDIQELYPTVPIKDIKTIITFFFRTMIKAVRNKSGVSVKDSKYLALIGFTSRDINKKFKMFVYSALYKYKLMYNRANPPWDNYYYFVLNKKRYLQYLKDKSKNKTINFGDVRFYKTYEYCRLREPSPSYIFRTKFQTDLGLSKYINAFSTDNYEFVEKTNSLQYSDLMIETGINLKCYESYE